MRSVEKDASDTAGIIQLKSSGNTLNDDEDRVMLGDSPGIER